MIDVHPFGVVRYPTYWVVVDKRTQQHVIVYESRSRAAAHREKERRNKEVNEARRTELLKVVSGRGSGN
jgi:hypothetical protein